MALERYQEALLLAREAREPATEILALNQLGVLAERRGALKDAENLYKQAWTLQQASALSEQENLLALNLARVRSRLGAPREAQELAGAALDRAEAAGDWELVAQACYLLGRIQEDGSEYDRAVSHLGRAATLFERAGQRREAALTRLALGRCRLAAGDPRAALAQLSPALTGLPAPNHPADHVQTLVVMARCYAALADHGTALTFWERAAETCLQQDLPWDVTGPVLRRAADLAGALNAASAGRWQRVLDDHRP